MKSDDLTSRYCICSVGEGFSVEDKRTGKRISYHRSYSGAVKRLKIEREKGRGK